MDDTSPIEQNQSTKNRRGPRFQLCFSKTDITNGRSDIYKTLYKMCGILAPMIITPKFYSSNQEKLTEEDAKEVESLMNKLATINNLGPREKYKEPVLESHRYGWFQQKLIDKSPEIDRTDFPKRTSDMVKMQNLVSQSKGNIGDR